MKTTQFSPYISLKNKFTCNKQTFYFIEYYVLYEAGTTGKYIKRGNVMELITSRKLKGRLRKLNPDLTFDVKDIKINGQTRGCSGFVTNPKNGNIVYVNTEQSMYDPRTLKDRILYRRAKHGKDYTGERNQWSNDKDIQRDIVNLLEKEFILERDFF